MYFSKKENKHFLKKKKKKGQIIGTGFYKIETSVMKELRLGLSQVEKEYNGNEWVKFR